MLSAKTATKVYYILDIEAFHKGEKPVTPYRADDREAAELVEYYDGRIEIYESRREVYEALQYYKRNR